MNARVRALEQRDERLHRPEETPPIVPVEKPAPPPPPPPPPKKKIGDLDGDGRPDIVLSSSDGSITILFNR